MLLILAYCLLVFRSQLRGNELTRIDSLNRCSRLERFYAGENKLELLPLGLDQLCDLTHVDLSNNNLFADVELNVERLTKLVEFRVQVNRLNRDIKGLGKLSNLKILYVSNLL